VINDTLFVPKNAFVTSANGFLNFSIPNLSGSELKIEGLRFVTTDGVAYNQETEEIVIGFPLMNNNRLIGFNITGHIVNKQTNQVEELTGNLAVSY